MDRRGFILGFAAGLFVAPLVTRAQTPKTVRRIGVLSYATLPTPAELQEANAPLRELGWVEGRNLIVERRNANGRVELMQPFAEELVRLKVEIIVTNGTIATLAAKNATTSIPIVMSSSGDPVRAGLVASLARPGGNVTGFSLMLPQLDAKLLALLHEVMPNVQRVGVLVNTTNPISSVRLKETEQVYVSLGLQPIFINVASPNDLENAVAEVARRRGQALIVVEDSLFLSYKVPIMRAALSYALPVVVEGRELLEAGGLLSYDVSERERTRRVAALLDKILRGAKPADLPIEQPTRFELVINQRTARALGLTIPQPLLLRADEVIE
jgi:putative tryptophan/tyrosine transport system substrate-binding protein